MHYIHSKYADLIKWFQYTSPSWEHCWHPKSCIRSRIGTIAKGYLTIVVRHCLNYKWRLRNTFIKHKCNTKRERSGLQILSTHLSGNQPFNTQGRGNSMPLNCLNCDQAIQEERRNISVDTLLWCVALLVDLPADGSVLSVTTYLLYPKLNVAIEKAILH